MTSEETITISKSKLFEILEGLHEVSEKLERLSK